MQTGINLRNIRGFLLQVYVITLFTCLLITVLLGVFSPSYKVLIFSGQSVLLAFGIVGVKYQKWFKFYAHGYIVSCFITLFIYAGATGGIEAPGMAWFMICPLIAHITLTRKVALFWLYIVLVTFGAFQLLKPLLVFDTFRGGHGWYLLSYSLLLITLFRLLNIFHKILETKSKELNNANNTLRDSQQRLMEYQQEVESQNQRIRSQNFELQKKRIDAIKRSEVMENYLNELLDIGRMEELHSGNQQYTIEVLINNLIKNLNLSRVSIWQYEQTKEQLELKGVARESMEIRKPILKTLNKKQLAQSFDLVEAGALINISDADNNKFVDELRALINVEYGFKALLVCPYFIDGRFAGVIGCESLKQRNWNTEEVMFVRAIADTLSLSYKSYERKLQQVQLEEKQQYIEQMNQVLEQKVTRRTELLKAKNEQLVQYAFMNSHEIRGPICRLLGLKNLLNATVDFEEILTIKHHMAASIDELDDITIRAGKILEEHMPEGSQVVV